MPAYRGLVLALIFSALVLPGLAAGAVSPEALAALRFNLYPRAVPANDLSLGYLKGGGFSLSSLRGNVVLLNFWRIDCPPCRLEKPILEAIHRKYASRGLSVIAVNLFDDELAVRGYQSQGGYTFPFAVDPGKRLQIQAHTLPSGAASAFVVNSKSEAIYEIPMVPTTYVIDRQGRVVGQGVGMLNWQHPALAELLETLLTAHVSAAEAAPAPPVYPAAAAASSSAQEGGPARKPGPVASPTPPKTEKQPEPAPAVEPAPQRRPAERPGQPPAAAAAPKSPPQAAKSPKSAPSAASKGQKAIPIRIAPPSPQQAAQPPPKSALTPGGQQPPAAPHQPSSAAMGPPLRQAQQVGQPSPVPPGAAGGDASQVAGKTSSPSALPRALPYVPERAPLHPPSGAQPSSRGQGVGQFGQRGMTPPPAGIDDKGYVEARMPSTPGSAAGRPPLSPPSPPKPLVNPGMPAARPGTDAGAIGGFLLESFGEASPPQPAPRFDQPQPRPQDPGTSLLGQLSKIGGEVKEAVSRIAPFK